MARMGWCNAVLGLFAGGALGESPRQSLREESLAFDAYKFNSANTYGVFRDNTPVGDALL